MKPKAVRIEPLLNGYSVQVGCQHLVFINFDFLCGELKRYFADPSRVEFEYREKALNPNCLEGPPGPIEQALTEDSRPKAIRKVSAEEIHDIQSAAYPGHLQKPGR